MKQLVVFKVVCGSLTRYFWDEARAREFAQVLADASRLVAAVQSARLPDDALTRLTVS